jgi:hypothetical protein
MDERCLCRQGVVHVVQQAAVEGRQSDVCDSDTQPKVAMQMDENNKTSLFKSKKF